MRLLSDRVSRAVPRALFGKPILFMQNVAVRSELLIGRGQVMFEVIGTIIFGAVIGVLARIVIPGKQAYGWIVTVLLGVAGALIGYWLWGLLGGGNTFGIDWIRWVISVAGAAILSFGYTAITRKSKSETDST
jgi:uncharacterized membrane protein YeaQ/YmgE (transglycosylase-associated protein family)